MTLASAADAPMRVDLFDFDLPEDRIALRPVRPRDAARLMVVAPEDANRHLHVRDLPDLLRPGDMLVVNDTKVIPAELHGERLRGDMATRISVTLYQRIDNSHWWAFARPARRLAPGDRLRFGAAADNACLAAGLDATVEENAGGGSVRLSFDLSGPPLDEAIAAHGHMPLPSYIASRRPEDAGDRSDYQTVYAREEGAVAAPTAGLHFTPELLAKLRDKGVAEEAVTLHVGPGTFLPVKADTVDGHKMHSEWGTISPETAAAINAAKRNGGRIVAVGTTSLRLLESAADEARHRPSLRRRDRHLHHAGLSLPRRRRADDEFPSAALDAVHARLRLRRARANARRLSRGDRRRLSLLFLRRRFAPVPGSGMTPEPFSFAVRATDGAARLGEITTPRGTIRTPAFMPVGTAGTVKAMYLDQVRDLGTDIILGNTYHLMLRPGAERVAALGGLHEFANWPWPILTDSGGFQVMSLAKLRRVDEHGVTFQSHIDGAKYDLTPERSIEIQELLDSDIQMQLDECIALPAPRAEQERAMQLSLRWAERSLAAFGDRTGQGALRHRPGR